MHHDCLAANEIGDSAVAMNSGLLSDLLILDEVYSSDTRQLGDKTDVNES